MDKKRLILPPKNFSKNLKEAALAYAAAGIPVFPIWGIKDGKCLCGNSDCTNAGKHPITKEGFKAATTDRKQIIKWWTKYPKANIGSPLISGLIALDFDGEKGKGTCKDLGLDKIKSPKVKTGRGEHLYFHADLKSKNNVLEGLDIRGGGQGGYIILPPSNHVSGVKYRWENTL